MRLALLIVAMLWGACAVAFSQNAPYSLSDHPSQDGRCQGDTGTQTGEAVKILAPPHYSPHEKWLVSVSASIGSSGSGNGIDIVPATFDGAERGWHYRVPDEDDWLYEFAGWEGDERVNLTVSTFNQPTPLPARVDLVNGTWRLTPPNVTPQAARP
jgi:hypothetical protein